MEQAVDIPVALCRPSPSARPVKVGQVLVLKASIQEVGLRQPINVRKVDGGYEVRGGGHRLAAFRDLGRETIPAFVREDDDLHAELAEIDENLCRNDLTPIERDIAIVRRKVVYEQLHPETVLGAAGNGRAKVRQNGEPTPAAERFTKATAEATGRGERTIQRSVARVDAIGADTLGTLVETSLDAPAELDALAQLSPAKREEVIERVRAGAKVKATVELKKESRDGRERVLAAKQRALPDAKFGLIYVDVPRHFNVHSDETGMDRAPENHYPTMSFQQLCDLPVARIAADDAILIYWSTAASLVDDLEIMAEWGFVTLRPRTTRGALVRNASGAIVEAEPGGGKYCSMQVWDKVRIGLGYWFRDRHEFVLVGVRGNVVPPAQGTQDESLFSEIKGRHSAKPDRVARMIDRLWPNTPKIEMFARKARPGWDVWGYEAPVDDIRCDGEMVSSIQHHGGEAHAHQHQGEYYHCQDHADLSVPGCGHDRSSSSHPNASGKQKVSHEGLEIPDFLRRRPQIADQQTELDACSAAPDCRGENCCATPDGEHVVLSEGHPTFSGVVGKRDDGANLVGVDEQFRGAVDRGHRDNIRHLNSPHNVSGV